MPGFQSQKYAGTSSLLTLLANNRLISHQIAQNQEQVSQPERVSMSSIPMLLTGQNNFTDTN